MHAAYYLIEHPYALAVFAVAALYAFDDCSKMKIVAQLAEVVGMNDVNDMPEVLMRAEEAGKKLGAFLKA